jgi:F-type H+-transporting ATPase subunit epsilon
MGAMQLRIVTPAAPCLSHTVSRLVAEAPGGYFGILPHHADFVTALAPGILVFEAEDSEHFVAVNSGTLVKCGADVLVAVRGAIEGHDLALLRNRVVTEFRRQDEDERSARSALARLEASIVQRFRELEKFRP